MSHEGKILLNEVAPSLELRKPVQEIIMILTRPQKKEYVDY